VEEAVVTVSGSATDHAHLRIYLARQVFIRLRSLARDATARSGDPQLDFFPGLPAAGAVASEVAAAGFFVRCGPYVEPTITKWRSQHVAALVLAVTWERTGRFGRDWIDDLAGDTCGASVAGILEPQLGDPSNAGTLADLRAGWDRSMQALSAGVLPDLQVPASTVGLCDVLALRGLCEIYGLGEAVRTGPDRSDASSPEAWERIKMVADTCHRLPIAWDTPAWLANVAVRRSLRDAWVWAGDPGRTWLTGAVALAGPQHQRLFGRLASRADRRSPS
jgi:hypothetical protein